MKLPSFNKIAPVTSYTIFWGWNVTFLVITLFGVMPWLGLTVTAAVLAGEIPIDFFISLWLLILVPLVSVWLARKQFRGQPNLQIRFFYGVEAPVFLLCLLRLFLFRELTFASLFIVGSILLAAFIYSRYLIQLATQTSIGKWALPLNSLLLVMAIYIGVLLSFYALPLGWSFTKVFFEFEWLRGILIIIMKPSIWLSMLWWMPFMLLLGFFSIALVIFLPIALTYYYGQAWRETWKQAAKQSSLQCAWGISITVVAAWLGIFILVDQQPQEKIFTRLSQPITTSAHKNDLLDNAETIRRGLLNAYLYRYRYLGTKTEANHLAKIYKNTFVLPASVTESLQVAYNTWLSPLLYQGSPDDDSKAAELYAAMFDTPIQKGERETISAALEATAYRDQVEAGLLNINQQQVWLAEQQITTVRNGSVTQVEIYEVYENNTPEQQEIFYYFSLPANAAVTGLWLREGSSRNNQRQVFTLSPRGAAQKVYKAQVTERVDPALLEQVGPRQYRLRAFPVPPRQSPLRLNHFGGWGRSTSQSMPEQDKMYLWLTYSVLNESKVAVLPELLEKRNVYWTNDTKRRFNGTENYQTNDWMPSKLLRDNVTESETLTTELRVNNTKYTVSSQTLSSELITSRHHHKLAILIDSSYSMRLKSKQIAQSLVWAEPQPADVFIGPVHEPLRKLAHPREEAQSMIFFGVLLASDLWNQAATLQKQRSYDVVFVLTDQGSYELSQDQPTLIEATAPIWLIHLDQLAPAYEDQVMYRLLSNFGGVATHLEAAYQQFLLQQNLEASQKIQGSYLWNFVKEPEFAVTTFEEKPESASDPIAAKLLIDYLVSQQPTPTLETLDTIHQLAKTYSVVTPYSSMIVLINDSQREQLNQAEQEKDRFARTVDSGIETLPKPENLMVSAVPEPETWILITISFLLGYGLMKRRSKTAIN